MRDKADATAIPRPVAGAGGRAVIFMGMTPTAAALAAALAVAAPLPLAAQPLRPSENLGAAPRSGDPTPASQRRPSPPWFFGRGGEPRLVPPRRIPAGRSGRAGPEPAPLPRTRPAQAEPKSGATAPPERRPQPPRAPGAIDVPVAPLD